VSSSARRRSPWRCRLFGHVVRFTDGWAWCERRGCYWFELPARLTWDALRGLHR
jgi:hypothetical protein